jgi:D-amino-acid dehydrogenase
MVKQVVIVGGGVVGMSAAMELANRGAKVTVIEKDQIGRGCSYGNAGWVTPCFALPLPMPGMIFQSIKWLLNSESPLYIKPSLSPDLFKWLVKFLNSMNEAQAVNATEALVRLSKKSLELYKAFAIESGNSFFMQERGLLMVSETSSVLKALQEELRYVSKFEVRGEELSPSDVHKREPILKCKVTGGIYFPDEVHLDPFALMTALKNKCIEKGVVIRENTEVSDFLIENQRISALQLATGESVPAELVLIATGSWTKSLARKIKHEAPILGGKGYSMILPKLSPDIQQPIMVMDRKLAITPHQDRLRIAGTLELVDQNFSITEHRAQVILKGAKECLGVEPNLTLDTVKDLWAGLRPCTPDGVPMIGFSDRVVNLVWAVGHQMLGLQSAMGTGFLVSDLIDRGDSELNSKVFDPNRF